MSNYQNPNYNRKSKKFPSELRYDLISKNWVVVATGRAKRPETFKEEQRRVEEAPPEQCPFCEIKTQKEPTLIFAEGKRVENKRIPRNWSVVSIPNLYPAFTPQPKLEKEKVGEFYQKMNAVGFHEVVVTRDHKRQIGQFSVEKIKEVIDVYHQRFIDLKDKRFVNYVFIFHNHGVEAGASIAHPHSQIITTPLIDSDLRKALTLSRNHFEKHQQCVYCEANQWEQQQKERVVFENENFLVLCPFASRMAFQMIISPKQHRSYFERISDQQKWQLAEAFQQGLGRLYKGLEDPPYNFYLHTAPCDGKNHNYYHWHFTILPKTATWAGFELGAGIEISTIEPEKAAQYLRKQKL